MRNLISEIPRESFDKAAIEREESKARFDYPECEQARPQVKAYRDFMEQSICVRQSDLCCCDHYS